MTPATEHELMERLADIHQLSPGIRFGELLANLGFLVEDETDQTLREVEDDRLLEIMERHRADLIRRQEPPNHDGLESAKPDLQSVFKKPGGGTAGF